MKALLRKDAPWILGFGIAGAIALASALCDHSGTRVFVLGADRLEKAFQVAWIAGLLLGAVAACFDELLGTRELVEQRPVTRLQLCCARLAGCAIVLAVWFLFAPLFAWLVFAVQSPAWQWTRWTAWSSIGATLVVAVSSCAIGFAAGTLPASWWRRLLAAGVWYLVVFGGIWYATRDAERHHDPFAFTWAHLAASLVFVAVGVVSSAFRADADRPWPHQVRVVAGASIVACAALLFAAVVREPQTSAVQELRYAYPHALGTAGEVVLVRGYTEEEGWTVVGLDHRPTARHVRVSQVSTVEEPGEPDRPRQFEFDAPRWHEGHVHLGSSVLLAADGAAWRREGRWGEHLRRVGKGPQNEPFGPGSSSARLDEAIVVHDSATHQLWCFDGQQGHFVALPPPPGDEVLGLDDVWLEHRSDADLFALFGIKDDDYSTVDFVRGRRSAYRLREGRFVEVPGLLEKWNAGRREGLGEPSDPITFAIEVPAAEGRPAFRHVFTPRTAGERWHAGGALAWSLLRPPVLQLTAHLRPAVPRPHWCFDVLVQGGRRTWLVLAGFALAALLAWRMRARLRRFGAPAPTVLFWTAATLLLGPVAALFCALFERPRAYADRTLPGPFPEPRIVTLSPVEEPVA